MNEMVGPIKSHNLITVFQGSTVATKAKCAMTPDWVMGASKQNVFEEMRIDVLHARECVTVVAGQLVAVADSVD